MLKSKLLAACGLALVLAACTDARPAALAAPAAAPAAATDLNADPNVRMGVLPNGMHYQIKKNATPPHNASLRMRIDVGSMYEREDQRGLAHFIEHMVLNGTKNVPEGEFVRRLERAGLKFGPDTNASTGFDETVYMLDLPETDAETVDTALFLLREVAGEATFLPSAIESERGIVLSEERTRATPQLRNIEDELGYLLKGDILPTRLPIGLTEVLKTAPQARFKEFYDAYYRPERATLIAVGDFDVDQMEAKIRSLFSNWEGRGRPGGDLPPARIAARGAEAHVYTEAGLPNRVSLSWVRPPDLRPDSRAVRAEQIIPDLGLKILNRRFQRIAAAADSPIIFAAAIRQEQAERAEVVQLVAIAKPGKWKEALGVIEQEQRRAAQFGFTQAELDREIQEMTTALTAAATGAATRPSPVVAQAMVAAVNQDKVFLSPAEELALFQGATGGVTAERVNAATQALFAANGPLVYMSAPTPLEGGERTLLAAYNESAKTPVATGKVQQAVAWPYESFGTPGTVAERKELTALGATAVRFQNGVRLTVKPTNFRDDEILVSVRFGQGQLAMAKDKPTAPFMLTAGAFTLGGLGKIEYEDLQQALASKVYAAGFGTGEDAFLLQGKTRPADFPVQLQVLAAYATDPALRPGGWERLRGFGSTIHDQLASTPGGVFQRDANVLLRSGDRRWALPSREEIAAAKIEEGKAFAASALQSGPVEVIVVGDITVDEAIRQVAATFGALPPRPAAAVPAAATKVAFPAPALVRETHGGRADQGLAFIAWPTSDFFSDRRRTRTLNLLGQVLQLRLIDEIREKQGTTYSPNASHAPSDTYAGYGYLAAQIEAPPEKLDAFLADAGKIAADLRDRPVTADELQRARKPLVENLLRQRASNEWWLSQLARVQTKPEVAQSIAEAVDQYQAITPAEVQAAARQYLVDAKAWKMEIVPEAKK